MSVQVSAEAYDAITPAAELVGGKKQAVADRLLLWYAAMPDAVQVAVYNWTHPSLRPNLAEFLHRVADEISRQPPPPFRETYVEVDEQGREREIDPTNPRRRRKGRDAPQPPVEMPTA